MAGDTPTCEYCTDTGWYGDNGPGRNGNNEFHECDMCGAGVARRGLRVTHDNVSRLERDLAAAQEQIAAKDLTIKTLNTEWKSRCDSLEGQIAALKAEVADERFAADTMAKPFAAALDSMDALKADNEALRGLLREVVTGCYVGIEGSLLDRIRAALGARP